MGEVMEALALSAAKVKRGAHREKHNYRGGFYKVFPVEDADQSNSGGLFRNSIAKKAKSYYSKFERNGNMAYTQQGV